MIYLKLKLYVACNDLVVKSAILDFWQGRGLGQFCRPRALETIKAVTSIFISTFLCILD